MDETLRVPGPDDLRLLLCQMLEDFAYLTALPSEQPEVEMPICYRAALPEGAGFLVLRGTRELGRQLADASTGGSGDGLDEDAFIELCNLCASHLVSEFWKSHQQGWKAFVPEAGEPAGAPESKVLLDVEGQALEVSYWKAS